MLIDLIQGVLLDEKEIQQLIESKFPELWAKRYECKNAPNFSYTEENHLVFDTQGVENDTPFNYLYYFSRYLECVDLGGGIKLVTWPCCSDFYGKKAVLAYNCKSVNIIENCTHNIKSEWPDLTPEENEKKELLKSYGYNDSDIKTYIIPSDCIECMRNY